MSEQGGERSTDARLLLGSIPFADKLGIVLETATAEEVTGRLGWAPDLCTVGGIMHGGVLMALADTIGAVCAVLNLPDGATTATVSSSANLMRSVRGGDVTASAHPLSTGRTMIVVRTELHDDQGRLAAQVTQAQAVLPVR
jgi:uncharacterized protein (TIGR00369 family)